MTAILFEPAGEVTPRRQVILLASPNACVAELGYQNDPSVGFYTSRGYHVAVYNYRGAGDSEGVVSPENAVAWGFSRKVTKETRNCSSTRLRPTST